MSEEKVINTDHNLENISDSFTAELPSFDLYLDDESEVSYKLGYNSKNVTQIDGLIDEFIIRCTGGKTATMAIKGRDYMRLALERNFTKLYLYKLPNEKRENGGGGPASIVPEIGSGTGLSGVRLPSGVGRSRRFRPKNEFGEYISYATGHIRASRVASEACASIGFELVWDAPDYYIVNEKENEKGFNGTVSSVLLELISILNHTEMFKIEISVKSKTDTDKTPVVYVKKRVYPYVPDQTIDLTDIRIKDLSITIEKFKEKNIKNIYVSRDETGTSMAPENADEETNPGTPPQVPPAEPPSEEDAWVKAPESDERIVENTDTAGNVLVREVYTTWTINGIVTKEQKKVFKISGVDLYGVGFGYELTEERETIYNYYGGGPYSYYNKLESLDESAKIHTQRFYCSTESKNVEANHLLENPSHAGATISLGTYKSEEIKKTETYTYNSQDELILQKNYDESKKFNEIGVQTSITTEEVIISHEYFSKDQIRTTTSTYLNGTFINSRSIVQAGQLPGPKKVGVIRNIQNKKRTDQQDEEDPEVMSGGGGSGDIRNETEVLWYKKFVVSLYGEDVKIHSNILSKAQLQAIAKQMKYEYLKTKCLLNLSVLPMPWIKKGMILKINGSIYDGRCTIDNPQGREIDLNDFPFFITGITQNYDARSKSYTGTIRGVTFIEP